MAAGGRLLAALLLCAVLAVCWAQTSPRSRRRRPTASTASATSVAAPDPTLAGTELTRRFLSEEQHQLLTSPSFGQRLTTRPRRRDWTPIWPSRDSADAAPTTATAAAAAAARPAGGAPAGASTSVDRAPVTEYYFASSAAPPAADTTFPPPRLPTATFASATPTRGLPPPAASPRPAGTRRGATRLADRLSALVSSRPARTRVISPTRAASDPPSSASLKPAAAGAQTTSPAAADAAADADADADADAPGLEPSTRPPWALGGAPTSPPAAAPAVSALATVTPESLSPTPASAPCVVTTQGPGGYCRDGDLLTVLTRSPGGDWQAYRTVKLPSSTVAALDGEAAAADNGADAETTTPDPVGVTPSADAEVTGQSTPEDPARGQTVTSPPGDFQATQSAEATGGAGGDGGERPTEAPALPLAEPTAADGQVETTTAAGSGTRGRPRSTITWPAAPSTPTTAADAPPPSTPAAKRPPETPPSAASPPPTMPAVEPDAPTAAPDPQPPTVAPEAGLATVPQGTPSPTAAADAQPPTPELPTPLPTAADDVASTRPPADAEADKAAPSTGPSTSAPENADKPNSPPPTAPTAGSTPWPTGLSTGPQAPETGSGAVPSTAQPDVTWHTGTTATGATWQTNPAAGAETTWQTPTPTAQTTWPTGTTAAGSTWLTTPAAKDSDAGKLTLRPPLSTVNPPSTSLTPPTTRAASNSSGTVAGGGKSSGGFTSNNYDYTTGIYGYTTGVSGYPTGSYPTGSTGYPTGSAGFTTNTNGYTPSTVGYTTGPSSFAPGSNGYSTGNNFTTNGYATGAGGYTSGTSVFPPGTNYTTNTDVYPTSPTAFTTKTTGFTSTRSTTDHTSSRPAPTPAGTSSTSGTSRAPGITHSNVVPPVDVYVQFLVATTWPQFCKMRHRFQQQVADLVNKDSNSNLTAKSVVLFNIPVCGGRGRVVRRSSAILVFLYLTDGAGRYQRQLTERVEPAWEAAGGPAGSMGRLVREVDTIRPSHPHLVSEPEQSDQAGVIAAVTVGCVAVASLVLLAVLLVIVRHRRRAAQTAQRCNPVSMEEYGVESVFSSMRRKNKLRRSVRSYLNHAFDDHDAPSNAVNFAGLANLSGDLAALKEEFDSIPTGLMPALDDLPPGSEDKNRYANVLPVPETRVVLEQKNGVPNSDYINANYVRGPKEEAQFYIATQGPLESTVNDFWRMIWETQSKVIVCLTDIVERGVRRCAEYLPPSEALDRHRLYGDFQVTLMSKVKKDKYVVSIVQLKNMDSNLFREVTHLWYSGWPERGVPSDLDSLVQFILEARKAMKTNIGPMVVHCSPGTGRTGVMLACDICVHQFEASRSADIMRTVFRLRQDRAGAVQTREQYALIYKVLNHYAASVTSGNLPALE